MKFFEKFCKIFTGAPAPPPTTAPATLSRREQIFGHLVSGKKFTELICNMKLEFGKKFLIMPQMTKTSQDNNGIIISIISIF